MTDVVVTGPAPAPVVRAWLERHPRSHLHFTLTDPSWLHQVERLFGLLTDKQLRRGVHKNLQALERDIRAWITQWNDNPHRSPDQDRGRDLRTTPLISGTDSRRRAPALYGAQSGMAAAVVNASRTGSHLGDGPSALTAGRRNSCSTSLASVRRRTRSRR